MPGLTPARENSLWPAAEGEFALDGADHLYFVDTYLGDNSITRWTMGGRGEVTADFTRPVMGSASIDDRPWLSAHGDGVVMYLGNGVARVNTASLGRYTAYMSYDGGLTFDNRGVNLADTGGCHGAADPRPRSKSLYVICHNDHDKIYAFVSNDDGRTFTRTQIGDYTLGDGASYWPAVAVGRDGTVHALFNLPADADSGVKGTRLMLFSSRDSGRSWRQSDVTPQAGFHFYSWLDVAPDGTIGVGYYFRRNKTADWYLYGGTARPGKPLATTRIAAVSEVRRPEPHGDFFQVAFGPDGKLHIAYTSTMETDNPAEKTDVYYVRQR